MKKSTRYTALALVALTSALLLGACGGNKQATRTSSTTKTSQSSKMNKTSTKAKAKTEDKTKASSSEEMKADSSANQKGQPAKQAEPAKEEKATEKSSLDTKTNEQAGEGKGYWDTTNKTGTLDFYGDTPVYVDKDKNSAVAFVQPAGSSLEWDAYTGDANDSWYRVVVKDGAEVKHYYVAYSDVGH